MAEAGRGRLRKKIGINREAYRNGRRGPIPHLSRSPTHLSSRKPRVPAIATERSPHETETWWYQQFPHGVSYAASLRLWSWSCVYLGSAFASLNVPFQHFSDCMLYCGRWRTTFSKERVSADGCDYDTNKRADTDSDRRAAQASSLSQMVPAATSHGKTSVSNLPVQFGRRAMSSSHENMSVPRFKYSILITEAVPAMMRWNGRIPVESGSAGAELCILGGFRPAHTAMSASMTFIKRAAINRCRAFLAAARHVDYRASGAATAEVR